MQYYKRPLSSYKPNKEWSHIDLTCCNESEKTPFLYEKVNRGQINKGQVDVFVKCLKLVLASRISYKNKLAANKGFITYVDSKVLILKPWKWIYHSVIRKSLGLKIWIHVFLRTFYKKTRAIIIIIICTHVFSCLEYPILELAQPLCFPADIYRSWSKWNFGP